MVATTILRNIDNVSPHLYRLIVINRKKRVRILKNLKACTSILVGKKASLDGSTMIARNDDTFLPLTPQRFFMAPAVHGKPGRILKSWLNDFQAELPADSYRYNAVPNVDYKHKGYYDESGINEKNVAMSCTESTYGNERSLAFDPLNTKDGLDEDCMQTMVLPYIDSARDGVRYLGQLIAKFGSAAGNSVLFSDHDEVWYMEIVTGHHWVAQRIPDDCYAVAANEVAIQAVDFTKTDDFMWSDGIQDFVEQHHLNPDFDTWNFRHIFGTFDEKDRHYNTPRVWYIESRLNPELVQEPESGELPFILKPAKKISTDDIEYLLGSHYNETPYDPFGHGSDADRLRYRPVGLNRTQNSHILQLRNDVPKAYAAIMHLCLGYPTFSPYVPFYTNANDTAPTYSETPMTHDYKSAYWLYKSLSFLVESHYSKFVQKDRDYLKEGRRRKRELIAQIDAQAADLAPDADLTEFLTRQNYAIVDEYEDHAKALMSDLIMDGINLSQLTFDMDKNL
ncbi:pepD2 protein [Schleiferilactobacillus perolens DSM 12744]|uniref:Dipeptidase n=1 Tax=Schleiferilactobacillus perolens DSM 12744 TaxID=1423792 RepID=A0A0R1MYN1_9LACO|nr:pepD2 protein [Schleiferilactobacillus perolens DSM 12744]